MESVRTQYIRAMGLYRYNGKWYKVTEKPYEPESQSAQVAWRQIKGETPIEAYKNFFEKQRKEAQILYPSFRKDDK